MSVRLFLFATLMAVAPAAYAQTPAPQITAEEQALCRPDAIRLCFFKLANADALRACLRSKKPALSAPCRALIEKRGN